MFNEDFMPIEAHFAKLVAGLSREKQELWKKTTNGRIETAYRNRNFIIYEMDGRDPKELDRIIIRDFECDDDQGASTELVSLRRNERFTVGYTPTQVFDYPVFVSIPLAAKVTWRALPSNPTKGSLAFPLYVRVLSRLHLREKGVTYFETGPTFGKEFGTAIATE